MIEKFPIRKEYLLIIASVALLLLSYNLALKKTIDAWLTNVQLKEQLNNAGNLSIQPDYLVRKNNNLNKIIARYKADTSVFRSNTLSKISLIAEKENVKLSEVPIEDPFLHTDKFIIQRLSFEGDFFSLTKVLNNLQAVNNIGQIRSVDYKSVKTEGGKDKKITLEVYFEIAK